MYSFRGMGADPALVPNTVIGMLAPDVLNPTAGTALDCGFFAGGVFKPECWCLSAPWLCSKGNYAAAVALAHPDLIYGSGVPAAAVPTSPALTPEGNPELYGHALSAVAATLPGTLSSEAISQSQENIQDYMTQVAQNVEAAGNPPADDSGINWKVWAAIAAVGVVGLIALGGSR